MQLGSDSAIEYCRRERVNINSSVPRDVQPSKQRNQDGDPTNGKGNADTGH